MPTLLRRIPPTRSSRSYSLELSEPVNHPNMFKNFMAMRRSFNSIPRYHGTTIQSAGRGLHWQTAPHLTSRTTVRRTALVFAGLAGVASLVMSASSVYLDGTENQSRGREEESLFTNSSTSHFSYSYYESSTNHSEDHGERSRSCHLQERSQLLGAHTGIYRYDTAQIASNRPPESEHAEAVVPVPSGYWSIFSVLDGRNGHSTCVWLRDNLIFAVGGALVDLYSRLHENSPAQDTPPTPSSDDIERTLKDTFKRLDRDIMHGSVDAVLSNSAGGADADALAPAHSGSSALLSFYDSHSRTLHVALTGDSRAVLGRRTRNKDGDVVYQVQVMTVEQDGDNLAEEYRLNARHPGEAVVYNGRVVGGGPTRSFGDALYKWDSVTRGQLQQASIGKPTPSDVLTPPYLTAEPEVTSTTVQPGDFLIMGTRAMWDRLTSEEAVGLVGMWLDKGVREQGGRRRVKPAVSPNDCLATPLAVGIRSESYRSEDRNVAMHLLRNSMSGDIGTQADTTKNGLTATVVFFAED